jgi:hypothetical protein
LLGSAFAPFDLDRGLDDFVVVSSMTEDLQASGQARS